VVASPGMACLSAVLEKLPNNPFLHAFGKSNHAAQHAENARLIGSI
jgi:hypothetical protein